MSEAQGQQVPGRQRLTHQDRSAPAFVKMINIVNRVPASGLRMTSFRDQGLQNIGVNLIEEGLRLLMLDLMKVSFLTKTQQVVTDLQINPTGHAPLGQRSKNEECLWNQREKS